MCYFETRPSMYVAWLLRGAPADRRRSQPRRRVRINFKRTSNRVFFTSWIDAKLAHVMIRKSC